MRTICLQAGHEHIQSNCAADMRGSTGTNGEISWTPMMRRKVAALLRAHGFAVDEKDANVNCGGHPRYDLTVAIHYQSNTGHSGFGVFVPDKSVDRDIDTSIRLARKLRLVYKARTGLPDYSDLRLKDAAERSPSTWANPNTLFYYVWRTQNGPLALIECGEAGHNSAGVLGPDRALLYNQPDKIASAIAEGICSAFGVAYVDPAVAAAQAAAKAAADAAAKARVEADAAAAVFAADEQAKQDAAARAAKDAAEAAHAAAAEAAAHAPIHEVSWQDILIDLLRRLLGR